MKFLLNSANLLFAAFSIFGLFSIFEILEFGGFIILLNILYGFARISELNEK